MVDLFRGLLRLLVLVSWWEFFGLWG